MRSSSCARRKRSSVKPRFSSSGRPAGDLLPADRREQGTPRRLPHGPAAGCVTAGLLRPEGPLKKINPIVRGWSAYYRTVVSSEVFTALGQPRVEAHLQMGQAQPPEQADALDLRQVLRPVQ
ncbi:group II intron maturase-specific domain-containing protein [Streptomyces sp. NPDC056161]|uniref:group II intron maturase-specific domain-containing protein n=1 Tax=Streptomyces sp. NPDC056161 TaxID=3345732 RepID=UPI0035DEE350